MKGKAIGQGSFLYSTSSMDKGINITIKVYCVMMDEKAFQQDIAAIDHYLWTGIKKGEETA